MSPEPELRWSIAGQITGAEGSGPNEIELGREVSGAELDRLNEAMRLLERLSRMGGYARAVQLLQTFSQELAELSGRERPPPAALLTPIARSAGAVVVALGRLPDDVLSVGGEFLEGESALEELRRHVDELEHTVQWRLAAALGHPLADPRRRLAFEDGRLLVSPEPLAVMAATVGVEPETISGAVDELLGAGVLVGLKMTALQLLACEGPIRESSLIVRRLAAEVLIGAPALLGFPPGAGPIRSLSMTHRALPLLEIQALQEALRRARPLVGTEQTGTPEPTAPQPESNVAGEGTPHERDEVTREEEAEEERQQDAVAPPSADTDAAGVGPEPGPPPPPAEPQPVDFEALLDHLSRLPAETERAWSKALDPELLDESAQMLRAQWASMLAVLYREANASEQRMRSRGIDPVLFTHPEDPAVLDGLNCEGDALDLWRALSVAQTRALLGVAKCLEGLTEPRSPFGVGGPDELTWWEAGAFALIRLRASELGRVNAQLLAVERLLDGSPAPRSEAALSLTGPWRGRLTLADEAVMRGDPEAAVVHMRLALRERAAQLAGLSFDEVPGDLEERLADDLELADMSAGLRLLAQVGRRLEEHRPASLGFALPVAELMLKPLTRLCLSLSGALIRATRGEDPVARSEEEQGGGDAGR